MKVETRGYLKEVCGGDLVFGMLHDTGKMKELYQARKGQILDLKISDRKKLRSVDISTHFHAHVTQIARETGIERDRVYIEILLLACEIEPPAGGVPYPYIITSRRATVMLPSKTVVVVPADVLEPYSTTSCTNAQMMTAVEAAHYYASLKCDPAVTLNEKEEDWLY